MGASMTTWHLALSPLPGLYAICRLPSGAALPDWAGSAPFLSVTHTRAELSIVCPQDRVPDGVQADRGWRCLQVEGPFDLEGAIGVLAALSAPLAEAGLGIFVVSTYDTDYLLVKEAQSAQVYEALARAGHTVWSV